ncbi:MAG: AI-2E family transporter, partial [Clostridia bacterium]|nr:AI-2E family transporter [Clostridia bacterium]
YEKNLIRDAIILVFPPKLKERAKEVYENIEKKVGGYVIAQVLSMSTVAILTAVGLMVLKVEYAVLLGLVAGLLDIVPIVGPTLAFVLGLLFALPQGWLVVLGVIVVYLAAQWISNNFIRPFVFGKFLDLHPIIIIFAFLIAAQFLGVWGVILSPAIAALLLTLFDELYLKTINKNEKCEIEEDKK